MKVRRSALVCLVFAAGAQLASGCGYYYCNRPFLCRPLFSGNCWPHCYSGGGGVASSAPVYSGGPAASCEPACSSCMSSPAGGGAVAGPGVMYGTPTVISGPTVQQMPGVLQAPMPTGVGTPMK